MACLHPRVTCSHHSRLKWHPVQSSSTSPIVIASTSKYSDRTAITDWPSVFQLVSLLEICGIKVVRRLLRCLRGLRRLFLLYLQVSYCPTSVTLQGGCGASEISGLSPACDDCEGWGCASVRGWAPPDVTGSSSWSGWPDRPPKRLEMALKGFLIKPRNSRLMGLCWGSHFPGFSAQAWNVAGLVRFNSAGRTSKSR